MKFLFVASTLLAIAAAQDVGSLPACGQMCVKNMLGLASSLGCSATDAKCLCSNANFAHGLNDCSLEACGPAVQASVVAFGTSYCSSAGVPLGGSGGATTAGGSGTTSTTTETTTTGTGTATGSSSGTATDSAAASSASSALSSAQSSASKALSSASSSISGALASASKSASGSGSSSSASGFAMRTAAPLAGAGALGLAAVFLV